MTNRTMVGISWSTFSMVVNQVLFVIRSIILARLLNREDFGLMSMALTVQNGFSLFTNFGLQNTIISGTYASDEELHSQLNTIWSADLIRRGFLTIILVIVSIPTAKFYGDTRLTPILIFSCLSVFVSGFQNVGLTLLSREVKFRDSTLVSLITSFFTTFAPVVVALWRHDVWALVWGQMAGSILSVVISYFYHPYRPRFHIDMESLRRSISYGKWFIVISAMVYVTTTADDIFVGKLLGPAFLGSYTAAYSIANMPQTIISKVLGGVLYPVFAHLGRNDIERLRAAVGRVLMVGIAILTLITVPMSLLSKEIVAVFYGSKWASAAAPLSILMLVGMFRGLIQIISPLVMGLNRPDLEARSKMVEAAVFLTILFPMVTHFGMIGAAWAGGIVYGLAFLMRYRIAARLVPGAFTNALGMMAIAAAAAVVGVLAGRLGLHLLRETNSLTRLLFVGIVSTTVTGACLLVAQPNLRVELGNLGLKKRLQTVWNRA